MSQNFQPGDYLVFQLESGYGLLRILDIEVRPDDIVWHLAAYGDFFLDVETADEALDKNNSMPVIHPHLALTNRAFESTQVARMRNVELAAEELEALESWKNKEDRVVSDRSVRLMLGLR
jgi:hypothetical protein